MNIDLNYFEISICIIAKNEEENLAGCLESVRPIAKEIIVADTGSTDKTIEIAESFGAKIFRTAWENDFAKARNFCLDKARYNYIISIDADERLVDPDEVPRALEKSAKNAGGWLIEVISEAKRKDGGVDVYESSLLRMFLNRPGIRFKGAIHEQIMDPIVKSGYKLENTNIKFLHLGYKYEPDAMEKKQRRNLQMLETQLAKEPNNDYMLYQKAKTLLALGRLDEAESDFAAALHLAPPTGAVRPQALNYAGIAAYHRGDVETAIERAKESLQIIPRQSFANFVLGECYSKKGEHADAYEAYRNIQRARANPDPLAKIVGDYNLPESALHFRLGRCLVGLNIFDDALAEFEKGLKINPSDVGCLVGAANVAFKKQSYDEARGLLLKAREIEPENADVAKFLKQIETELYSPKNIKTIREQEKTEQTPKSDALLSVAMIVKNEENMLPGCLESVKNVADEIIVVDTGSTDATVEIANDYGAKVYNFEWVEDFAKARNESIKHCSGEWILYIDADERLNKASRGIIRETLERASEEIGAIVCTIESPHLQLDGGTEVHRGGYPRIFRNYGYPTIYFKGRVHEQITPSIIALGKSADFSDIVIEHLGYDQSREIMEKKIKRNYKALIKHVQEEPLYGYAWYQLGQTLAQMGLFEEAENAIRMSIQCGDLSDSIFASATATLAQLTGNKKNFAEALNWADKSLEKAPKQVYAMNLKAYALHYLGRAEEAVEAFREVLKRIKHNKGTPRSGFDIDIPESVVKKGLNEARKNLNKK